MAISAILFCFYGRGVAVPAALPTTIQSSADNRRRRRRHRRRDVASAVRRRHRRSSLTAPGEIPFFLPSSFFFLSFCFSLSFFSFFFLYILHRKFGRWRRYFFWSAANFFLWFRFLFFSAAISIIFWCRPSPSVSSAARSCDVTRQIARPSIDIQVDRIRLIICLFVFFSPKFPISGGVYNGVAPQISSALPSLVT